MHASRTHSDLFGRYRLLQPIGVGGMAVVYRAVRTDEPGRELVIKRVLPDLSQHPTFTKMLADEAKLAALLDHPGIVKVLDAGKVGQEDYLALEYVDGVDLARVLRLFSVSGKTISLGLACHIVCAVAAALEYAHELKDLSGRELGVVHRDVSPSNVMLGVDGSVKLLDFGVAKAAAHIHDERTRTGIIKGKIRYLSPEQAEGLPVDRRSDIFSLGAVLYELVTLRRCFFGDTELATLRLVRNAEIRKPTSLRPDLPAELERIVCTMLARDREQRYPSCAALLRELQPLAASLEGGGADVSRLVTETREMDTLAPPAPPSWKSKEGSLDLEVDLIIEEPPAGEKRTGTLRLPPRVWRWSMAAGAVVLGTALLGVSARSKATAVPPLILSPVPASLPGPLGRPPAPLPAPLVGDPLEPPLVPSPEVPVQNQRVRVTTAGTAPHVVVTPPRRRWRGPAAHTFAAKRTDGKRKKSERYLLDPFGGAK